MKRRRTGPVPPRTNMDSFNDVKPEYYFEGRLRKVRPYYFEYQTYAKERWLDRTILDVFSKEFRDRPAAYYKEAIERQLITMDGAPCTLDTRVHNSALIGHRIHRHEPPVSAQSIRIVHEADGMLVVDKPASIPVHPSGRYRFNTLVEILRYERGYRHLSVINRLDRLTSGLCILATSSEAAEGLHQQMEEHAFRKEYVAKVSGVFPDRITCDEPLLVVEHKLGLVSVDRAKGKKSHTEFNLLHSNGRESVVLCRPLTGRTHQIRVHLKSLGFPIINDVLYNNPIWPVGVEQPDPNELQRIAQQLMKETVDQEGAILDGPERCTEGMLCPECQISRADPTAEQLYLYLHAWRYSSPTWSYETDLPAWVKLDE